MCANGRLSSHCIAGHASIASQTVGAVRQFFAERNFLEVETPILSADVTVDRQLDPMSTVLADDPRQPNVGRRLWLQTSPEFGMKRLLAAGATAIYQITRAFRNGEIGSLHNPEFTIVEWYRTGDDMAAGIALLSDFCRALLNTPAAAQISYENAFQQYLQVNPHTATPTQLRTVAEQRGISVPAQFGEDRDQWLNLLLAECVEPNLGQGAPTILYDYPASQAALAKVRNEQLASSVQPGAVSTFAVAERFELYVRVDGDRVPDHVREHRRRARPGADHLFLARVVHRD